MLQHIRWDMMHKIQKQKQQTNTNHNTWKSKNLRFAAINFRRLTQWSALNFLDMYFAKLDTSCDNLQHYVQHKSAQSYQYKSED